MSRKTPKSPPPIESKDRDGWVKQIRKYKVITPLYGGGEETQKPDSVTVVRASEVRGHLRFWWRATRGGAFHGNLTEMRTAEETIWGSSGEVKKPGPSKISIAVLEGKQGKPIKELESRKGKVEIGEPQSAWSYVAFPLRKEAGKKPAGTVVPDVSFTLEIRYPQGLKEDVEAALWAWETFGGIGARTRRGFGALQLTQVEKDEFQAPKSADVERTVKSNLVKLIPQGYTWPKGVPHLSTSMRLRTIRKTDAISAWEFLFNELKSFRQKRYPDSNGRNFGRSKWPEPDAIRRLPSMTSASKHKTPRSTVDKFPRAKFGLPIIFKFKDDDLGDPSPTTLQGANSDRLASPLILRPIVCSDGAIGLAVILEWEPVETHERYTPPGGLILKDAPGDPIVLSDLEKTEAASIEPLYGNPDVLQAFLNSLK
jgi:CRISPR-associated protein Cmr1